MNQKSIHTLAALAAAAGLGAPAHADEALGAAVFGEWQRMAGAPGAGVAIAAPKGRLWHAASGLADVAKGSPVTPQTVLRLGSVSKFVTTMLLGGLVERGRIDLDQPVARHVPGLPEQLGRVTPRQLATHTGGVTHYQFPADVAIDMRAEPFASAFDGLVLFKDRPLAHPPGTRYLYSSFGFNLLAAAMERAAGQPFPALLDGFNARFGTPSLQPERPGAEAPHWARLYRGGAELPRQNITHKWAGGGLLANAGDLARAGLAVLDRGYLSAATLERFMQPARIDGAVVRNGRHEQAVGWRLARTAAGATLLHHSGSVAGGRAHLAVDPGERLAIAILANADVGGDMDATAQSLVAAWRDRRTPATCRSGEVALLRDGQPAGRASFGAAQGHCRITLALTGAPGAATVLLPGRAGPAYVVQAGGVFMGMVDETLLRIDTPDASPVVLTLAQGQSG